MIYLLDTCCISDFVKGNKHTLEKIKTSSPSDLAVSSIVVMEIQYGLLHNPDRAKKIRKVIDDFISSVIVLPYTDEDAQHSAMVRAKLRKKGSPIGSYDVLIAGAALSRELILVTANVKEFERVPNLKVENWR